ncbi:MAG: hypothetical protein GX988_04980 [Clostridiales bacterium]|nr:hypothetical protein [Clostridiales bacterium]
MNLITCNKDCIFQNDGYCTLDNLKIENYSGESDCCYYKKTAENPVDDEENSNRNFISSK